MTDDPIASERQRAHELLALGRIDVEWRDEQPAVPDPASIGALDGFRLVSTDDAVTLSIYVYEDWGGGIDAGKALEEMVDGATYSAGSTTNGRLMAFAVATARAGRGRQLVDEVLGALAGWE